jgi:hypothetical protein
MQTGPGVLMIDDLQVVLLYSLVQTWFPGVLGSN